MISSRIDTLLAALLSAALVRRHILTVLTTRAMSTAVDQSDGGYAVEHPGVIEHLAAVVAGGSEAAVVLRSFTGDISHTLANGTAIPVKHVCGWSVHGGAFHPFDAGQMFAAFHTDAGSGEPIAPEPGVEITDAWAVDLTGFYALSPEDG
ncbi:hypothetical protein F4561_002552 [Lipingzhangella halophila]|uniref:Uncharacterized protein n=1 Tax=Lipingzhangella halophila TaxID=1783352 RepID=A0A7W7RH17_9ACTN|nr:hypothetical protein [Lipingzhangella halophila]MBB4931732.1 hypothetical protein [Lipingzhangella halophila]